MSGDWMRQGAAQASAVAFDWRVPAWHAEAACRGMSIADSDRLFFRDDGHVTAEARTLCGGCPVRVECGLASAGETGVWAGLSAAERDRGFAAA